MRILLWTHNRKYMRTNFTLQLTILAKSKLHKMLSLFICQWLLTPRSNSLHRHDVVRLSCVKNVVGRLKSPIFIGLKCNIRFGSHPLKRAYIFQQSLDHNKPTRRLWFWKCALFDLLAILTLDPLVESFYKNFYTVFVSYNEVLIDINLPKITFLEILCSADHPGQQVSLEIVC